MSLHAETILDKIRTHKYIYVVLDQLPILQNKDMLELAILDGADLINRVNYRSDGENLFLY